MNSNRVYLLIPAWQSRRLTNTARPVDTARATASYEETTEFDGANEISCATGSQWEHETLYRSIRGRYYIVHTSAWQGARDYAEWLSPQAAVRWLSRCAYPIPAELAGAAEEVTE